MQSPRQTPAASRSRHNRSLNCAGIECTFGLKAILLPQRLQSDTTGADVKRAQSTFGECYGPVGQGYIEAHHLRPISTLGEGVVVTYDVATDFAVLCPNCHRMIHRLADPSNLDALRAVLCPITIATNRALLRP
jgi:hypothetical protein